MAKFFYMIAKLRIVQRHYIRKYNFSHRIEDGWSIIYSGGKWIDATGVEANIPWEHTAGMLGLANNPLVIRLIGRSE